jgi:adenine-specific DNA-methyltransferase
MKKMTAHDPETKSANVIAGNIQQLISFFPEAVCEGKLDFEVLKQLLGGVVDEREEKYGLNWQGKRQARQLSLTPSTGTLRPCPDESVDWDTTQNLMIEGDNLEVLKLLQKSYAGKVKLIYIDPPYNTGNDFVYPDDFHDNIKNYQMLTGQIDSDGRRISSHSEASGRFHTDWLNMIYPRLNLARQLLRDDGAIVVSIDDQELPRLRQLLDEIFGEENFIAVLVWDRNRKNDAKYFSVGHEYMVVYVKNESVLAANQVLFRGAKDGVEEVRTKFEELKQLTASDWNAVKEGLVEFYSSISDDDPRAPLKRFTKVDHKGPYRDDGNINWPGGDGPRYEVLHPITRRPCKIPTSGWRYPTPKRLWEEVEKGRVVFGPDETTVPRVRTNLFENSDQVMVSVHYSYAQTSANEFISLFDGKRVFDNPKPVNDIRRLTGYLTGPDDLICDFFSGAGTTGHAVMAQNATDNGRRRFILVQLPEPLDADKREQKNAADFCDELGVSRTIAEITKERLRRATRKIRLESPDFCGDVGFRVFKLDSSNITPWDADRENLDQSLIDSMDHIKPDRLEQDVLFELLLKLGLDLCVPIERRTISDKIVHSVGAGVLMACLATDISKVDAEPLALGIIEWHRELNPAGETTVVFRDTGFADDVAKTNLAAILQQHGLENVRSL